MKTTTAQPELSSDYNRALGTMMVRESTHTIADLPERLRPDAELDRVGVENVADVTLLSLLLTGNAKVNALDLAREMLTYYISLAELRKTPVAELRVWTGMTEKQARRLVAALELGARAATEGAATVQRIVTPADVTRIVRPLIQTSDQEIMYVLILNTKNMLVAPPIAITKGLLDASLVHPREVFRMAIRKNAAGIILAHNHPTGDSTPSAEDIRITRQLIEAGKIVDIRVLDHVVVTANGEPCSIRESGLCDFSL